MILDNKDKIFIKCLQADITLYKKDIKTLSTKISKLKDPVISFVEELEDSVKSLCTLEYVLDQFKYIKKKGEPM